MTKKGRRKEGDPAGLLDQLDLFVTLPGDIPTHDEQEMMERPFFSLSKQRRSEPIDYSVQNGTVTVTVNVTAPAEIGIATIWDCDILIWAVSQLRAAKAAGQPTTPHFHVPLYELLRGIDRPTGGDEYRRIVEALERLSATLIRTNIRQGKKKRPEGFHWIERYSAPTDDLGRSTGVEFTISDWLYEGVLTDRLVLGIDRAYFKLTGGIERWLYRVVRKHGGHQAAGWAFTMKQLHHKSGSTQRLADFAKELRIAVERQRLPGYWLELVRNDEGEEVLNFQGDLPLPAAAIAAVAPAATFWSTNRMRWNRKPNAERPEYPKLVALAGTAEQARELLPALLASDPDASLMDGGARGVYARVHNEAAETAARQHGESRSFPLA